MCGGVTGPAWALPVPVPGSVSGLGHGWRHRRKPWSPGGLPEYYFFFRNSGTTRPAWKKPELGLSPVLPGLWPRVLGGSAVPRVAQKSGMGMGMAARVSAVVCRRFICSTAQFSLSVKSPCCTGRILLQLQMKAPPGTSHPSPPEDIGGLGGLQENLSALNVSVCTALPLEPRSEQKSCGKWLQPVNGCQGITHGSVPRQKRAPSLFICERACVLHEKAFLINRPAALELDKKWSQKDLINPSSVPGACSA